MDDDKKEWIFIRNFLFSIRNIGSLDLCVRCVINVSILFVVVVRKCRIEVREDSFYAVG